MDKQKCQRCEDVEYIPTYQYIKLEQKRYELCETCWSIFNKWMYEYAIKEPKPNPGKQHESGLVFGREPAGNLSTGREPGKIMPFKREIVGQLEKWLSASQKDNMDGLITQ